MLKCGSGGRIGNHTDHASQNDVPRESCGTRTCNLGPDWHLNEFVTRLRDANREFRFTVNRQSAWRRAAVSK